MTDEHHYIGSPPPAPMPAPAAARRSFWRGPGGIAVAVIAAIALIGGVAFAGYSVFLRDTDLTVEGSLVLVGRDNYKVNGVSCNPDGGYSDISAGTQVVVTDAAGATIGIGSLKNGENEIEGCVFAFRVENVPIGHDFYGIAIGKRGNIKYTPEQLAKPVELSLGD